MEFRFRQRCQIRHRGEFRFLDIPLQGDSVDAKSNGALHPFLMQPLSIQLSLAGTPARDPEFQISVRSAAFGEIKVADPRATRAMVALMDMQAVQGGAASHWGGPSAFAELMSAAHGLMFSEARQKGVAWHDLFLFANDGGHCENGLYALKANYGFAGLTMESLKGFRSIQSPLTGHGESHLWPQGVLLSNGPLGSALPQTQGLAFAEKHSGRQRVTLTALTDGACMEGEAREALAAIPGLAKQGKMAPYVLIISDNNTGLTGRLDKLAFSMTPTFAALQDLGWHVMSLENGHDLQKCVDTLEAAIAKARKDPSAPVVIHAKTIKGYGIKKTMESSSGGHGFPLKDPSELRAFLDEIYAGAPVPPVFMKWVEELETAAAEKAARPKKPAPAIPEQKVQVGVSNALIAKRASGLPVVSISSDLPGSTGVADFQKKFADSTQDVGVAESNMVSMAAGLSKLGYIPVVDTFAQFGVTKGALPLTMAALSQAPVIAIFSHVGFQDAADGASHQALSYFAMTSSIPETDVYALTSSDEAEALVAQAVDKFVEARAAGRAPHSQIFFLGRENFPAHYGLDKSAYKLGTAQVVLNDLTRSSEGRRVVIAAAGAMLGQALSAAQELANQGVGVAVVNPSVINRPDVETFRKLLAIAGDHLLTVEDHQLIGGMGQLLSHALLQAGVRVRVKSLGVKGEFGQSAYNAIDLYKKHKLDATSIREAALELLS